jgi:hypothetical protein
VVVDTLLRTIDLVHQSASQSGPPDEVRQRLFRRLNLDEFIM